MFARSHLQWGNGQGQHSSNYELGVLLLTRSQAQADDWMRRVPAKIPPGSDGGALAAGTTGAEPARPYPPARGSEYTREAPFAPYSFTSRGIGEDREVYESARRRFLSSCSSSSSSSGSLSSSSSSSLAGAGAAAGAGSGGVR